jgi:hypothetical protein
MSLLEKQKITEDFVRNQSKIHFGIPYEISTKHFLHSFGTHFGTKPSIITLLYNKWVRTGTVPEKYKLLYLLWALYFLRSNETDLKLSAAFGYSVMTIRKWIWVSLELISNIKVVSFFNFFYFYFIIITNIFYR